MGRDVHRHVLCSEADTRPQDRGLVGLGRRVTFEANQFEEDWMGRSIMPGFIRTRAKRLAEVTLASPAFLRRFESHARGRTVVLAYHNVVPDSEPITGSQGAHIPLRDFRWQMDLLQELCEVVELDGLTETFDEHSERIRAVVTFDDAYAGTLKVALPELEDRGLPSTVFVPSGHIGGKAFWWDRFRISGWEGERIPLERLEGCADQVDAWGRGEGLTPFAQEPHQLPGSEQELLSAAELTQVRFGVHSHDHLNLTRLDPDRLRNQLESCRSWLEERGIFTSRWVSYPYGLTGDRVEEAVRELGYVGGLTINGGYLPSRDWNSYRSPRLIIPAGATRENFLLRIFGVISS
jgi:peptidoglycan/xylan/chitin deacetylase (PgdA/CDA1 family)